MFAGHSLGGIAPKQVLIMANSIRKNHSDRDTAYSYDFACVFLSRTLYRGYDDFAVRIDHVVIKAVNFTSGQSENKSLWRQPEGLGSS